MSNDKKNPIVLDIANWLRSRPIRHTDTIKSDNGKVMVQLWNVERGKHVLVVHIGKRIQSWKRLHGNFRHIKKDIKSKINTYAERIEP
jgi:hypothetical protein